MSVPDKQALAEKGYAVLPAAFDPAYIERLAAAVDQSYELCRGIQQKNGVAVATDGTVHHLLATGDPVYLDLAGRLCEPKLYERITTFFGGNFILNSYGGVINLPARPSYVARVHRDIRFFSGNFPLMLNVLIMLDDFTLANGATHVLAGSHLKAEKPSDAVFFEQADRITGKKGDLVLFDSNLWHAAGGNRTPAVRRAITITLTKPFMKQQLDYCRALGYDTVGRLSAPLQQMLGFLSRTPSTLEEWYQPPEKRFYRPGQD